MINRTNISIAVEALVENKFRSGLTALGIIFGVAAVITMLAIGNGAEKEILSQLELVGVNNIVVTPIPDELNEDEDENENENENESTETNSKRFSNCLLYTSPSPRD